MSLMYATVTSKGQVTLPVELRRALGIKPGQTVGFRQDGDRAIMEPSGNVEEVRDMLERAARRNGTWGTVQEEPPAWQEAAVRRYADS